MKFVRFAGALIVAAAGTSGLVAVTAAPAYASVTTFTYTGAVQTYTIPAGATKVQVVVKGSQGGGDMPGYGGVVTAVITTPSGLGNKIQVMVGGSSGWNGGGSATSGGASGGGASDIRQGACAATSTCGLSDRTVVAGGGGGGVTYNGGDGGKPGMAGYNTAGAGTGFGRQGTGGGLSAGGTGGLNYAAASPGGAGSLGAGGNGGAGNKGGSGGGGGYYGGGGGGGTGSGIGQGGPGGGGSSYADPARLDSAATFVTGDNYTTGSVEFTTLGPPAPGGVGAEVTAGTGNVGVSWSAPPGGADSYVVYKATSSSGPYTAVTGGTCAGVTGTSCTVTGLSTGQEHWFTVASVLGGVEGSPSSAVSVTAIEPPGPPVNVGASVTGDVTLSVTFDDPSTGAAPATGFQVLMSAGGGSFTAVTAGTCAAGPVSSPCTVTGLTAGAGYRFKVVASNAAGSGTGSDPSSAVTAVAAPGAPTPGAVTVTGPGTVTVAWSGPTGPVTGFKVYVSSGGSFTPVGSGTCSGTPVSSPCTATNLTPGQVYQFKVSAVATGLEGNQSVASGAVTAISAPLVTGVPVLSLAGDRALRVTWTYAVSVTAPAARFGVEVSKDGGPYTSVTSGDCASPTVSPCVLGSLDPGGSYRARVTAVNAAGTGSASSDSVPLVALAAPGTPVIGTVTPGDGQVEVAWTPGTPSGTVTFHAVATPAGSGTPAAECVVAAPAVSCIVHGLSNTTTYTCKVYATNGVDSEPSGPATATPSVAPGSPAVTATAGVASIAVQWTPATAGSGISGYLVTAEPGPATCAPGPADSSCVLGAEAGVTYTIKIIAKGTYGRDSAPAVSGAVTPVAPAVPGSPPAPDATLTTDKGDISSAAPGQQLVVVGHGFAAWSTVTIAVYSTPALLATATADANGDVHQPVTVPASLAAGVHSVVALGVDQQGVTHTLAFTVTVAPVKNIQAGLPVTGTALTWMFVTALSSLFAGAALRLSGRRAPAGPVRRPRAGSAAPRGTT